MNIELEQLEIVKILLSVKDEVVLDKVKNLLLSSRKNEPISIEQYNQELNESEGSYERGQSISHKEVKSRSAAWRNAKDGN